MKSIVKYIGQKFGKITILEYLGNKKVKYKCDCGIEKECNFYDIKRGKTTTCGCWKQSIEYREKARKRVEKMRKEGVFKTGGDYNSDEKTLFKYIWKCLNNENHGRRNRKPNFLIFEDLELQWEKQKGICPYLKIQLILPTHKTVSKCRENYPSYMYASLDRIDSSKPYTKDNIQFISRNLNYAKHTMSHDEFENFLNLLVSNRTSFCAEEEKTEQII